MSRFRLAFGAAAILAVVAALALVWYLRPPGGEADLVLSGTIEGMQVDVSARISARITALPVREGQLVQRGAVVVTLADEELAAEARRAEGALVAAQAQLRDLIAGARREEIQEAEARAARAESQLADLLAGARRQEIEQARAAVQNAEATRIWAERDYRRAQELFDKQLVAAQEVDRARQAYAVAVANETGARERLDLVAVGPREHEVAAARAEVRAARERVQLLRAGPRPDAVAAARAQVAQAEAAITLARARLAEATIAAPLDGLVLRKNMEAGETANPGVPILTLLDPRDLWLRAYVAETDIGRVRIGQAATIVVDSHPGRGFAGAITEIASEAEFTPKNVQTKKERVNLVFRVKIGVHNPDGVLKPGMPADAALHSAAAARR